MTSPSPSGRGQGEGELEAVPVSAFWFFQSHSKVLEKFFFFRLGGLRGLVVKPNFIFSFIIPVIFPPQYPCAR
jgi:hypothetical protein